MGSAKPNMHGLCWAMCVTALFCATQNSAGLVTAKQLDKKHTPSQSVQVGQGRRKSHHSPYLSIKSQIRRGGLDGDNYPFQVFLETLVFPAMKLQLSPSQYFTILAEAMKPMQTTTAFSVPSSSVVGEADAKTNVSMRQAPVVSWRQLQHSPMASKRDPPTNFRQGHVPRENPIGSTSNQVITKNMNRPTPHHSKNFNYTSARGRSMRRTLTFHSWEESSNETSDEETPKRRMQCLLHLQALRDFHRKESLTFRGMHGSFLRTNKNSTDRGLETPRSVPSKAVIISVILHIVSVVGLLGCGGLLFLSRQSSRQRTASLYTILLLFPLQGWCQERKPINIEQGPSSGIIVQEAPGLILTERRLISQLIFVDLDPELAISKRRRDTLVMGRELAAWYNSHVARTKESVRNILDQLVRTFIGKDDIRGPVARDSGVMGKGRKKRFAGAVVGLVALTVVGIVIGTVVSTVNAVTIKKVAEQTAVLRSTLGEIQKQIISQQELADEMIQVINTTVVIQNHNGLKLIHSTQVIEKLDVARRNLMDFIDPITFATQEYLREFQNSISCLIRAQIPLYFITNQQVKTLLSQLYHLEIDDLQVRVALEMGSAVTMYIDPEKLHLSFLLQLPLVMTDRIYQTKKVFNTGMWRDDTYMKIKTPEYLAYQNWSDGTILVPRLETCIPFKDINFLCPGKPFSPDPSGALCGIQKHTNEDQKCDMIISKPTMAELNTVIALVQDKWLVSSRLENVTVSYALHGTFQVIPLPYRVSLISVPKDAVVSVGDKTLFHVPNQVMDGKIELINSFPAQDVILDPDLDYLVNNKMEHTVQLAISPENIKVHKMHLSAMDSHMLNTRDDTQVQIIAVLIITSILMVWIMVITSMTCHNTKYRKKISRLNEFRKAMVQAADYTPIYKGRLEVLPNDDGERVTP